MALSKKNEELRPCDNDRLAELTGNSYEAVVAASTRSKRILERRRLAFRAELEDLNIHEEEGTNDLVNSNIQDMVSRRYEMSRKPLLVALDELFDDKVKVSYEEEGDF